MDDVKNNLKNNLNLLDVTLRDGGYINNFKFSKQDLNIILTNLDQSNINYIEIGYINGPNFYSNYNKNILNLDLGKTAICNTSYLNFCNKIIKNTKIAAMMHPSNIAVNNLNKIIIKLKKYNINLIRLCANQNNYKDIGNYIKIIQKHKIKTSVNIVQASQYNWSARKSNCYSDNIESSRLNLDFKHCVLDRDDSPHSFCENPISLKKIIKYLSYYNPDIIYFADSNGALYPEKVAKIYDYFTDKYQNISWGFHAHDNLGLAQANSIAAINSGCKYIDISLAGIGNGIGNLRAELFIAYLLSKNINQYDLNKIIIASNYVRNNILTTNLNINDFYRGIYNLNKSQINITNIA